MRSAAIILVLALGACAPSLNLEPRTNDVCYAEKSAELDRINAVVEAHGFGARVFHRSTHSSDGYAVETWWGFERSWYVSFQADAGGCSVSRGSF